MDLESHSWQSSYPGRLEPRSSGRKICRDSVRETYEAITTKCMYNSWQRLGMSGKGANMSEAFAKRFSLAERVLARRLIGFHV